MNNLTQLLIYADQLPSYMVILLGVAVVSIVLMLIDVSHH